MHVVATNIILWIRTLMKESLEEISEAEEEHELEEEKHFNETVQLVFDKCITSTSVVIVLRRYQIVPNYRYQGISDGYRFFRCMLYFDCYQSRRILRTACTHTSYVQCNKLHWSSIATT